MWPLFLISSMVLGPLDLLYLIEWLGLITDWGMSLAAACDISKPFNRVWHSGFLHRLKS